jgi:hypothetical protein
LKEILERADVKPRTIRWILILQKFDYILYKEVKNNLRIKSLQMNKYRSTRWPRFLYLQVLSALIKGFPKFFVMVLGNIYPPYMKGKGE